MKTAAEQLAFINKVGALKGYEFTSIINVKQSIRTYSVYVLATVADGTVYQVAFSDHDSDVHYNDVMDYDEFGIDDFDEIKEFKAGITTSGDPFTYFGFSKATKYNNEIVNQLLDNNVYSKDRAYSMGDYKAAKIIGAELLNDGQVLHCSYEAGDEYYINYSPNGDLEDAIAAQVAKKDNAKAWEVKYYYTVTFEDLKEEYLLADLDVDSDEDVNNIAMNDNEFIEKVNNYYVFKNEDF